MEQSVDNLLLCDEVWLTSPGIHAPAPKYSKSAGRCYSGSFYKTKEDCEEAFGICLQKESTYMPEYGYQDRLQTSGLFIARLRAMQWLVKTQIRLNLSCQTVFNAANYFDRFLSMNLCKGWKYWMVELLAIACLSVATKFVETIHPTLHELQMEDLDHSFQSSLIQRMELTLLKALEWKLGSITAYSYVELLMWNIDFPNSFLLGELTTRVTELLLGTLHDSKFLKFRPCVIAIFALRCVLKESLPSTYNAHLSSITTLIPQDQKDDLIKCHKIMEEERSLYPVHNLIARRRYINSCSCPSSPVTVLTMEQINVYDSQVDWSLFKTMPNFNINGLKSSKMKRKRED